MGFRPITAIDAHYLLMDMDEVPILDDRIISSTLRADENGSKVFDIELEKGGWLYGLPGSHEFPA